MVRNAQNTIRVYIANLASTMIWVTSIWPQRHNLRKAPQNFCFNSRIHTDLDLTHYWCIPILVIWRRNKLIRFIYLYVESMYSTLYLADGLTNEYILSSYMNTNTSQLALDSVIMYRSFVLRHHSELTYVRPPGRWRPVLIWPKQIYLFKG